MSTKIWVWYAGASGDGYVRLKLRAGEPALHTFHGGRDEEGWSTRAERWWVEDGVIHNQVATDGVDCDGRMSTHAEYVCGVEDRHSRQNLEGWLMPAWETAESGQRDYSAEAANY